MVKRSASSAAKGRPPWEARWHIAPSTRTSGGPSPLRSAAITVPSAEVVVYSVTGCADIAGASWVGVHREDDAAPPDSSVVGAPRADHQVLGLDPHGAVRLARRRLHRGEHLGRGGAQPGRGGDVGGRVLLQERGH